MIKKPILHKRSDLIIINEPLRCSDPEWNINWASIYKPSSLGEYYCIAAGRIGHIEYNPKTKTIFFEKACKHGEYDNEGNHYTQSNAADMIFDNNYEYLYYTVPFTTNKIYRKSKTGIETVFYDEFDPHGYRSPYALAFDEAGNLFVSGHTASGAGYFPYILNIDPQGNGVIYSELKFTNGMIYGLAFDDNGILCASLFDVNNKSNEGIYVFDANAQYSKLPLQVIRPGPIAFVPSDLCLGCIPCPRLQSRFAQVGRLRRKRKPKTLRPKRSAIDKAGNKI